MHIHPTRRQLVQALLLLGASGMAAQYWHGFSHDDTKLNVHLPQTDSSHPSFEVFAALSRIVTLRDHLDQDTARRMYDIFMDEPWGPQHLSATYEKLHTSLAGKGATEKLSSAENWFVSHLLTTWYLGVYYHEKRPTQRITYDKALMFEAVNDWLPIPFLEGTGPGNWQNPPEKKA